MLNIRNKTALAVLAASAGLAGCTGIGPYGGIGVGVGTGGYDSPYGYGYGSPYGYGQYGYGSAYGYDPYGYYNPYYRQYAGYPYYGWYDGFYYPGSGYWLYDPYGRRYPIADNEKQSNYWSTILRKIREERGAQVASNVQPNWSGFSKQGKVSVDTIAEAKAERRAQRQIANAQQQVQSQQGARRLRRQQTEAPQAAVPLERQQARAAQSAARAERQQAQAEQRSERVEQQDVRQSPMRERIMERRRARGSTDE